MTDERRTTLVLLFAAFLVYTFGRSATTNDLPTSQQLGAWAILAILLAIAVDIDSTAQVAGSLALLLLVTILLLYGQNLFNKLGTKAIAGRTTTSVTTRKVGPGTTES
jgi:hypothetical protein